MLHFSQENVTSYHLQNMVLYLCRLFFVPLSLLLLMLTFSLLSVFPSLSLSLRLFFNFSRDVQTLCVHTHIYVLSFTKKRNFLITELRYYAKESRQK